MKHFVPIFLSLLLLVGCGAREQLPALESKGSSSLVSESASAPAPSSSEPSSVESEPEESSTPESPSPSEESVPDPVLEPQSDSQTGRILAMGNELLNFSGESKVGTQDELDRWETAVNDPAITRIDFCNMHQEEQELPAEQEEKILTALRGAELRLYDSLPNPSTGGACHVIAYDGRENIVFQARFMWDWFCVRFGGEDVQYVFNGEGTSLNDLFGIS